MKRFIPILLGPLGLASAAPQLQGPSTPKLPIGLFKIDKEGTQRPDDGWKSRHTINLSELEQCIAIPSDTIYMDLMPGFKCILSNGVCMSGPHAEIHGPIENSEVNRDNFNSYTCALF